MAPAPTSPSRAPAISAVLPAYNEEASLPHTVAELANVLRQAAPDHEIIVVDDGSTDRTAAVARDLTAAVPALRLVQHGRNQGYGAALRTGFGAAAREWTLLLDADGQFDPTELPRFIDALATGADLVLGYRARRVERSHRLMYARAWRLLMRVLFGFRVRDIDCAFKLMRTTLVQSLDLEASGAFISAELLAKAHRVGASMAELPVTHRPRRAGRSTGGNLRVLVRAFYELARLAWRVRRFAPAARGSGATATTAAEGEPPAPRR